MSILQVRIVCGRIGTIIDWEVVVNTLTAESSEKNGSENL